MAQKPNHKCIMCGKDYYLCEASVKLSSYAYVYKTQFCSPECYGKYLEIKESQRQAKDSDVKHTAETVDADAQTKPPRGRRSTTKAVDEAADVEV